MATDLPLTKAWSAPTTTTADTIVQAYNGPARITSQANPDLACGVQLAEGDALVIKSGVTFRARSTVPAGGILAMEEL